MPDELKPCPWCGSVPSIGYRGQPAMACFVGCPKCRACGPETTAGMTGSGTIYDQSAFYSAGIEAWNTRATETALREQLREAVGLLETSHYMVDTDEHRAAVDAFLARVVVDARSP